MPWYRSSWLPSYPLTAMMVGRFAESTQARLAFLDGEQYVSAG